MKSELDNSKKHRVLYVDDETKSLKYFEKFFGKQYEVILASSVDEAWAKVQALKGDLSLVISDQRMPEKQGVELLSQLRREYPSVMRILTTAYSDLDSAVAAINDGFIYRYVVKPWVIDDLGVVIRQTLDYYQLLGERDQLINEKLSVKLRLLMSNRVHGLMLMGQTYSDRFNDVGGAITAYLKQIPEPVVDQFRSAQNSDGGYFINSEMSQNQTRLNLVRLAKDWGHQVHQLPEEGGAEVDSQTWLHQSVANLKGSTVETQIDPSCLSKIQIQEQTMTAVLAGVVSAVGQIEAGGSPISLSAQSDPNSSMLQVAVSKDGKAWDNDQLRKLYSILLADEIETGSMSLFTAYLVLHHHGGEVIVDSDSGTIKLIIPATMATGKVELEQDSLEALMDIFARWDSV